MAQGISKKTEKLHEYFRELEGAAIAFSGGVDSSVLAKTAHDVLGKKAVGGCGREVRHRRKKKCRVNVAERQEIPPQ